MKLFYKPGACSLATHITLNEIAISYEIDRVDTEAGKTSTGLDFKTINPKGYVPALLLESGEVLTEGAAVLQYLADTHPEHGLAPKAGSVARARLQEYLNFISSELHKAFTPLFTPSASVQEKEIAAKSVGAKLDCFESLFSDGRSYLLGESFSVADAYLFVVCSWPRLVGIDLKNWPNLAEFAERVSQRSSVQAAMKAEGLI
ncbi:MULTISPECIES: glutathione transferase GstA [unclassified Pseudovibrio]|uniref:glutathione transferase GstA n=1 Tax=unclassified Pseudovibrio TaxID=2627060 RepID=UPI0007AE61DB|nr:MULTISPECIES: glutathione transferase GstA [unclassified Pseudovibrio]KZL16144.1 Glutathione S-transferase GST-6.0 [Pseudovibrio sp. Ad26]KZL25245.1 Glutathione S-transferase GST-6.0 [Pseudovibrio sp. WM33]